MCRGPLRQMLCTTSLTHCKVIGRGAHLRWIHQNECHGCGGTGGLGWGQGPYSVQWSATGQPVPGCAAAACLDSTPQKGSKTQTPLSKSKQVMHVSDDQRTACGSGSLGEPADRIVVTSSAQVPATATMSWRATSFVRLTIP